MEGFVCESVLFFFLFFLSLRSCHTALLPCCRLNLPPVQLFSSLAFLAASFPSQEAVWLYKYMHALRLCKKGTVKRESKKEVCMLVRRIVALPGLGCTILDDIRLRFFSAFVHSCIATTCRQADMPVVLHTSACAIFPFSLIFACLSSQMRHFMSASSSLSPVQR